MSTPFKYPILSIIAVTALFIGGCSDNSTSQETDTAQNAQSYYKVRDIKPSENGEHIFIASKEGLSLGHLDASQVAIDKTYGAESMITPYLRFVAVDKNERYIVSGGEGGLFVSQLKTDRTLGSTSSYFQENNANTAILAGDLLITSTYHFGLRIGEIDAGTATLKNVTGIDTESSPALPQNVVTALALDPSGENILIGMQREGVAVAHIDTAAKRIDTITPLSFEQTAIRFVSDIAVHSNGLMAIVGKNGITIGRISNGNFQLLQHHTYPLLPFRQYTHVAISHSGTTIAVGTGGKGVLLATLGSDGALSNQRTLTTATIDVLASNRIFSLAFSSDDSRLLIGNDSAKTDTIVAIEL